MSHYKVPAHLWESVKALIQKMPMNMPVGVVVDMWGQLQEVQLVTDEPATDDAPDDAPDQPPGV